MYTHCHLLKVTCGATKHICSRSTRSSSFSAVFQIVLYKISGDDDELWEPESLDKMHDGDLLPRYSLRANFFHSPLPAFLCCC